MSPEREALAEVFRREEKRRAVGQDNEIKTATKLHIGWLQLQHDYDHLWSHVHDEEAEKQWEECLARERGLSEVAAVEIGHNTKLWHKWLKIIYQKYDNHGHDSAKESAATTTATKTQ